MDGALVALILSGLALGASLGTFLMNRVTARRVAALEGELNRRREARS